MDKLSSDMIDLLSILKRMYGKDTEIGALARKIMGDEMRCNQAGIDLICEFEGFYSKPYLCPANVPTIGYGTTIYPDGKKVALSDSPITKEQAKEYLAHDLKKEEDNLNEITKKLGITLNENQFSALISFAYNLGFGKISSPSSTVNRGLKSGDHALTCHGMSLYNRAAGKVMRGLTRRRSAEIELYNKKEDL